MLRVKDLAKLYRVVLRQTKPLHCRQLASCPYGQDPRPVQDPLRRRDREACPPPPPPPPPPKDDSLLWGAIAAVCVTAAFCFTAKSNPEIRDWITIYAPWFDDMLAVLFQENMSYMEFSVRTLEDVRRLFRDYLEEKEKGTPKECSLEPPKEDDKKPIVETMVQCDENEEEKVVCEIEPPPLLTLDILEVERCLKDLGETMLLNYMTARDACRCYNKTVEDALSHYTQSKMEALQAAEGERKRLVKESLCNVHEAKSKLEQLSEYLTCGVKSCKEDIQTVCEMVKNMRSNIERMKIKYQWEDDKAAVLDDEWKMVKEGVDTFMHENEAMFPGLKYSNPKSKMTGDLDLLLHHSSRLVQKLQAELDEAAETMTERINQAVDALPYCPKRCNKIMAATAKKQAQLDCHYNKLLELQKAESESVAQKCIDQQRSNFEEQLEERLEAKQKSLEQQLGAMVAEQVAKERKQIKLELNNIRDKLKEVEARLNARLKAESESRRSQELWSAGARLLQATNKGQPHVCVQNELKAIENAARLKAESESRRSQELQATNKGQPHVCVQNELEAIENAGKDDALVTAVLGGIPPAVRNHGLVPASALKRRYNNMESVAQKVAMVELEGGPLPIYALSWIQSLFLFMKLRTIPIEELGQKPTDPVSEDLDTFDLLQRARYHMDRDELPAALRYVSALQGASRGAAHAWLKDARAHLAARQAAVALLAHAQALAVNYI